MLEYDCVFLLTAGCTLRTGSERLFVLFNLAFSRYLSNHQINCAANDTVTVCCDSRCTRTETAELSVTQLVKLSSDFLHLLLLYECSRRSIMDWQHRSDWYSGASYTDSDESNWLATAEMSKITVARHAIETDCGVGVSAVVNTCRCILVMIGDRACKSGNTLSWRMQMWPRMIRRPLLRYIIKLCSLNPSHRRPSTLV